MNLGVTIYIGYFKPFTSRHANRLENFNEMLVSYATYMIVLFTGFVPEPEN